jgi:hypothetical protein
LPPGWDSCRCLMALWTFMWMRRSRKRVWKSSPNGDDGAMGAECGKKSWMKMDYLSVVVTENDLRFRSNPNRSRPYSRSKLLS